MNFSPLGKFTGSNHPQKFFPADKEIISAFKFSGARSAGCEADRVP